MTSRLDRADAHLGRCRNGGARHAQCRAGERGGDAALQADRQDGQRGEGGELRRTLGDDDGLPDT